MPSRPLVSVLAVVLLGLTSGDAAALELVPISREFTPAGSGAVQSYEVVNQEAHPVAVEISVVTRALDIDGNETSKSAEDDFLIYPPQIVVPAGSKQTVRVTWLGDPAPKQELAYRLVVQQVSIARYKPRASSSAPKAGAIEILMNYRGSVYVRPRNAQPGLAVESTRLERSAAGRPQLVVMLHNRGTSRAVLKEYELEVKPAGTGDAVTVSPGSLELKSSIVLADGKRRLAFPWPHDFEPGEVTVRKAQRH